MARNRYVEMGPSDNFDGLHFRNPTETAPDASLLDVLRWRWTSKPAVWPKSVPVTPAVPEARVEGLRATMVGHATLLIQVAGLNVLTDPVWSVNAGPWTLGPKRAMAPGIAFDDLPPIDIVLLSHNHYDHLDVRTLARLVARDNPLIVTPYGNDTIVRAAAPAARVLTGGWWGQFELDGPGGQAAVVSIVPANHWSARGVRDRRMALWGGFVLEVRGRRIYFAGDTGYGSGAIFRDIAARFPAPELALIPIGAYAPRWFMAPQHIDPFEAVQVMQDVGAGRAVGIHWGTFQLTDEAREEPAEKLAEALLAAKIDPARFVAAAPGDVFDV
jgi:L-ascorbate metabolism protein UlaG (beta-lactamase superfamily)